jgi:hypothetical protein
LAIPYEFTGLQDLSVETVKTFIKLLVIIEYILTALLMIQARLQVSEEYYSIQAAANHTKQPFKYQKRSSGS